MTAVGQPGSLLGVDPVIDVPEVVVDLPPGSLLACFTDGVSECHDGPRFFVETGIAGVLAAPGASAANVVGDIEAAARSFAPRGAIRDDMAIVVARVQT